MARTNVSFATPAGGTVWLNWVTGFSYSPPDSKFTGFDSFRFRWWDKAGFSEPVTVNLRVGSVGDGPVEGITPSAGSDSYATHAGQILTVSAGSGLLANDAAYGGATLGAAPQTSTPTAQGGHVTVANDGSFVYVPPTGVRGPDSFEYAIVDSYGATARATATIDLLNNAPTAGNLTFTTNRATPVTANLLAGAADADGDPLTVSIAVGPFRGSISLEATTGAFTYTPALDWVGIETIPFTVSDGFGGSVSKAVTVEVANAAPVAIEDSYTTDEDTPVYIYPGFKSNDNDPDDNVANTQVIIVTVPSHGELIWSIEGYFGYKPDPNWNGTDQFQYKLFDGREYSNTVTVTIQVNSVPDPTQVYTTFGEVPIGSNSVTVVPEIVDGDGVGYSITDVVAEDGTAVVNSDLSITYTSDQESWNGYRAVSFNVIGGVGGVTPGRLLIQARAAPPNNTQKLNKIYQDIRDLLDEFKGATANAVTAAMDAVRTAADRVGRANNWTAFITNLNDLSKNAWGETTLKVAKYNLQALALANLAQNALALTEGDDFRLKGILSMYAEMRTSIAAMTARIKTEIDFLESNAIGSVRKHVADVFGPTPVNLYDWNPSALRGYRTMLNGLNNVLNALGPIPSIGGGDAVLITQMNTNSIIVSLNLFLHLNTTNPNWHTTAESVIASANGYTAAVIAGNDYSGFGGELNNNIPILINKSSLVREALNAALLTAATLPPDDFRINGLVRDRQLAISHLQAVHASLQSIITAINNSNLVAPELVIAPVEKLQSDLNEEVRLYSI
jgi:hypothetical protein